ncbi:MAG: flagellar assembly protein FliW [Lachnospiraceae bacterium]|nr:flagellar assembly protein FliW [Lachnospiraceae bacterium]
MLIESKFFGNIEVADDKIIHFETGLVGFEDYKDYTILFDTEKGEERSIMWLQCTTKKDLALPVVDPLFLTGEYNPVVEDELLKSLGGFKEEDLLLLVTLTVPSDITQMTANYKAPIVINSSTLKGIQIICENEEYKVKHPVYDIIKARKGGE